MKERYINAHLRASNFLATTSIQVCRAIPSIVFWCFTPLKPGIPNSVRDVFVPPIPISIHDVFVPPMPISIHDVFVPPIQQHTRPCLSINLRNPSINPSIHSLMSTTPQQALTSSPLDEEKNGPPGGGAKKRGSPNTPRTRPKTTAECE